MRLKGRRIQTAHLEIRHIASLSRRCRAGIVVPRYSHTAVERNRVKRRLREIVRVEFLPQLERIEFVVRALPSAYLASFDELREHCRRACDRLTSTSES